MNDALFNDIAIHHIGITTLQTRNSTHLDFYSVAVWEIHAALRAAYLAGYAASVRAARGEGIALPTQRHTMLGDVWLGEGEASDFAQSGAVRTVTTLPIPETELLAYRWQERRALDFLIPEAVRQRRID